MAKKPKAAPSLLTLMDRIYRRQTALDQRLTMIVKTQSEIIERLTPTRSAPVPLQEWICPDNDMGKKLYDWTNERHAAGIPLTAHVNGHDRAPPRSITLCADRDSHEPNKPCQVCEWRG